MLKRWRVVFNPVTEYFQHRHLWVLLSRLPLHFWNEGAYKQSGTPWAPLFQLTSPSLSAASRKIGKIWLKWTYILVFLKSWRLSGEASIFFRVWII
jgi:hypothetical protein